MNINEVSSLETSKGKRSLNLLINLKDKKKHFTVDQKVND